MLTLLGIGVQATTNGYDIIITCQDDPTAPTKTLELKLKTLGKKAALSYKGKEAKDSFKISIEDANGFNSSSDVWIKNGSKGNNGGVRNLNVSAQRTETFRVTHFANFSVELEEDTEGAYRAINMSMTRGTAEYPDSLQERSEVFENMPCVITRIS